MSFAVRLRTIFLKLDIWLFLRPDLSLRILQNLSSDGGCSFHSVKLKMKQRGYSEDGNTASFVYVYLQGMDDHFCWFRRHPD